MPTPETIVGLSLPQGAQPNQAQGCCAECYSNTLGTSAKQSNPVPVNSDEAVQICLPSPQRKRSIFVNTGLTVIYIGFGFSPTALNYSIALAACLSSANDGTGGIQIDEMWQGSFFAISDVDGGTLNFTELT